MDANGFPVVSVAERLEPQRLFEFFLEHRRALRMEIIGLDADAGVGQKLTAALTANRVVALVADRDLGGRGIEVEMFGGARRLPAGPALLSLTSGAPIVVCDVRETHDGWVCIMHEPLAVEPTGNRRADVTELTRRMAAEFERAISASPPDWHLFQPGWKD
jgi:KDO2-lipid IV(A) lauroyltransferase